MKATLLFKETLFIFLDWSAFICLCFCVCVCMWLQDLCVDSRFEHQHKQPEISQYKHHLTRWDVSIYQNCFCIAIAICFETFLHHCCFVIDIPSFLHFYFTDCTFHSWFCCLLLSGWLWIRKAHCSTHDGIESINFKQLNVYERGLKRHLWCYTLCKFELK